MYFRKERIERILEDLKGLRYPEVKEINTCEYRKRLQSETVFSDFVCGQDTWGDVDSRYEFRFHIEIPEAWQNKPVVLHIKTGQEDEWDINKNPQCLVKVDGQILQGMDINHTRLLLPNKVTEKGSAEVLVHAYSGFQKHQVEFQAKITTLDQVTEALYFDLLVPLEVSTLLDDKDKSTIDMMEDMNDAVNLLDMRRPYSQSYYQSVDAARCLLDESIYSNPEKREQFRASCIGHTHIDVAWLWDLKQTREKVVRSFATVLKLMEEYEDYRFMSSQPQLYEFLKEEAPELYDIIKRRVEEGRFEPEGAMWVEADCNLTSGESLVRQMLYGTRFFRSEFGVRNEVLWLPDVFGYSAALPQIMNQFGIKTFMTTKISWNEYNKMPYDTFTWRGIDGTEILTHFATATDYEKENDPNTFTTYNGMIDANHIMGAWQRYQQKDINDDVLVCYGYGDGGGGPTYEMLETANRMAQGLPGCPTVALDRVDSYFDRLHHNVGGNKRLPVWVGELYLEYHRGTYTSMAKNKWYNRKSEFLYHDAECLNTLASLINEEHKYPKAMLDKGWKMILLNQFHDILPGTSIGKVYEDSHRQYEQLMIWGQEMVEQGMEAAASKVSVVDDSLIVFNTLGYDRTDCLKLSPEDKITAKLPDGLTALVDAEGGHWPVQYGSQGELTVKLPRVPAKGYRTFTFSTVEADDMETGTFVDGVIETGIYRIEIDAEGHLTSIYDKVVQREVVAEGQEANVFQVFEDKPHNYDAWDINIYYQEKMWIASDDVKVTLVENGPVRMGIRIRRGYMDSVIDQTMYLYKDSRIIEFETEVEWKERHSLLKVAFPVDIFTTKATYDIQFGNVERPTHWNTSWDYARFEVCGHKWADLSEGGYGVSLLNDCKYGYDIKDNVMRLSLIKSATKPYEDADKGHHQFTYALLPHEGPWSEAETVSAAYELNCPMRAAFANNVTGDESELMSLVYADRSNVVIETVKQAEDSDMTVIRTFECHGKRTKTKVHFGRTIQDVAMTDMAEEANDPIACEDNSVILSFEPYEVKTLKVKIGNE